MRKLVAFKFVMKKSPATSTSTDKIIQLNKKLFPNSYCLVSNSKYNDKVYRRPLQVPLVEA